MSLVPVDALIRYSRVYLPKVVVSARKMNLFRGSPALGVAAPRRRSVVVLVQGSTSIALIVTDTVGSET